MTRLRDARFQAVSMYLQTVKLLYFLDYMYMYMYIESKLISVSIDFSKSKENLTLSFPWLEGWPSFNTEGIDDLLHGGN